VERAPLVAASATRSPDGTQVAVFLLNRHHELPLRVELDYHGGAPSSDATIAWVSGPRLLAENRPGKPEEVTTSSAPAERGRAQEIELPARSITVVAHAVR
jgi:alpha-L-arabinofuranosidase